MKYALIIGNDSYSDPKLAQLKTPAADSRALANVLEDEKIGGFDEVTPLINQTETEIRRAISSFLESKRPDDLVLVYFSGHGVLDSNGRLFLASKDTQTSILRATAIPSSFIADEMDNCRSKRQILILDCCHSGAFARGVKAGGQKAVTEATFEGSGYGRVVLTASDSTQFALEGDQVISRTELSLFTHFLLEGLKTGDADTNNDGYVSLDEWYDYTYSQVLSTTPRQVPHKWSYRQQGDLLIAKNPQSELIKRKAAEKAEREEIERVAAERRYRENLEREITERMTRERQVSQAAEKDVREQAEPQVARKTEIANLFSKAKSSNRIIIIVGILIVMVFAGSWGQNLLPLFMPTEIPNATITPSQTIEPSRTPTKYSTVVYRNTYTPTVTPTMPPTSTPIPQSSILFQKNFEDGAVGEWSWKDGVWVIEQEPDGNYYLSGSGPATGTPQIFYVNEKTHWTDYALETRVKFIKGYTLYILIRSDTGSDEHYGVAMNNDGFSFMRTWSMIGSINSMWLSPNRWYMIRVEIKGDLLSEYIDNALVQQIKLQPPLINQGGFGYVINDGDTVYFDSIKVWSLK